MVDLISRKALIDFLDETVPYDEMLASQYNADWIYSLIESAPAVDAVEVVRCKECKHWKHITHLGCTDFVKVCGLANYMIGENGHCLYGERKEN